MGFGLGCLKLVEVERCGVRLLRVDLVRGVG